MELAIKFGVSRDIINLLLEAGAKPVSSELLHESAVMLASKSSSPFLVDLLNYVTEPKLLNNMDSSGKYSKMNYSFNEKNLFSNF